MLTEESKQKLYALARDDAERQRLWAALQSDTGTDTARELFQLLAVYATIGGASFAVASSLYWLGQFFPDIISNRSLTLISAVSFFGAIPAISWVFATKLDAFSQKHSYVITLAVGIIAGYYYHGYYERRSDVHLTEQIAIKACLASSSCVSLAKTLNNGVDVRYLLVP